MDGLTEDRRDALAAAVIALMADGDEALARGAQDEGRLAYRRAGVLADMGRQLPPAPPDHIRITPPPVPGPSAPSSDDVLDSIREGLPDEWKSARRDADL